MSYILEALKKAEQERNLGQVPPLTQSQTPLFSAAADTLPLQRATAWLLGSALLIAVGAGALGHWFAQQQPTSSKSTHANKTATQQERPAPNEEKTTALTPTKALPSIIIPSESPPTNTNPLANVASVRDPQTPKEKPNIPQAPPTAPPVAKPAPPPQPVARVVKPTETENVPVVATAALPEIQNIPLFQELPAQTQQRLSPLVINIHVYAEQAQQRFVLINGRRFREGMTLQANLTLLHIRPTDIILRYQDQLFRLNPL
ncbi:general secretion pathway protein GspB [Thioflexithrix psekupsensis]|uniref:Type II secretion system protein GspB C-terminal domain-containing protein n=1 Tax=Thioflexithrix psekupsensis TaxID=1570016 RepID=A0A251X4E7_9GAMM|nr:general secretion pathway protein GspB [Thioflexithrix psekupsensis]OUD12022.1 hypothetical protein TPSD3_12865 [Thioflexithrix psekupsensis]